MICEDQIFHLELAGVEIGGIERQQTRHGGTEFRVRFVVGFGLFHTVQQAPALGSKTGDDLLVRRMAQLGGALLILLNAKAKPAQFAGQGINVGAPGGPFAI